MGIGAYVQVFAIMNFFFEMGVYTSYELHFRACMIVNNYTKSWILTTVVTSCSVEIKKGVDSHEFH